MDDPQHSFESSSKLAAQVESHCEFLTCIRHNVSQRTHVARGSFKTLEEYLKDRRCNLNTEGLLQLIVELAYFFYACKIYQAIPAIDINSDLRVEQTSMRGAEKRFSVVIWYKIEEGRMKDGMGMKLFVGIVREIQKRLDDYLSRRIFKREGSQQQLEQEQLLDLFYHQLEMLADSHYFEQHEPLFFLCLEQTTIFYEISMMYLIKNCSIMDFIKTNEGKLSQFRISKVRDQSLVVQYKKEKGKGLKDQQSLTAKQKEIETNITQFFKAISDKQYFQLPSKNEKDQTYRVKFNYTIREREKYDFQEMVQSMQDANVFRNDSKRLMHCRRTPSQVEYFIEYSSQKNQICVRLYNISLISNFETSDFQIFQSNVFIYESLNVSIELSQPRIRGIDRSNRKVLTFKGTACFNEKEPPLERILLLMDVTMIASKIYEPELKSRPGASGTKDYQRLSTISKKINHYTKLFMKCAKKIYSE